jgi:hypothetical protein
MVPGLHQALGMQLPPGWMLLTMVTFPVLVWAPDEIARAIGRRNRPHATG